MPCAPVPLCTARSSLNATTLCLTSATSPCGPQTTTALSPSACSSVLRITLWHCGRPLMTAMLELSSVFPATVVLAESADCARSVVGGDGEQQQQAAGP